MCGGCGWEKDSTGREETDVGEDDGGGEEAGKEEDEEEGWQERVERHGEILREEPSAHKERKRDGDKVTYLDSRRREVVDGKREKGKKKL